MASDPAIPVSSSAPSAVERPAGAELGGRPRRVASATLFALAFFAACAVLVTWPAILTPRRILIGHPGNDTWNHVWGFWWVVDEIVGNGRWPGWTDLINWPKGGSLYFIDTFNAILSLPIQVLAGPVVAYNAVVMGSLLFTAVSAWLLARHVVRDPWAALVAGVVYGFSPHLLAQAHNAITETLNAGWLALYLLFFVRLLERPSLKRGLLAWVVLVACGLSNWYYALFAGLATVVLGLWRLLSPPYPTAWGRAVKWGLVGALPLAPLAALGLYLLQSSMNAPDALVNRDPDFVWNSLIHHNISDLVGYFRPGRYYSPDLKALYGEDLLIVTYLGWGVMGLAAWGLIRERYRRDLLPWALLGLVFWIFSLGPYLHVAGSYLEVSGRRVPMPFLAFFEALPLFSRISHPFRFVVVAELCLGVLAAMALRQVSGRLSAARRPLVGIGAGILLMVEIVLISPAQTPLVHSRATLPEACHVLREDPEPGAVLDLPLALPILEHAVYNWYQVYHRRPIPYTLNEPMAPSLRYNQLAQFILGLEAGRSRLLPRTLPDLELVLSSRILARQGYRYVVVHDRLYPKVKREQIHTLLSALFGIPAHEPEGGITIYKVP